MYLKAARTYFSDSTNIVFLKKALVVSLITILLTTVAMTYFSANYAIQIDSQVDRCLPGKRVYLVDKNDKTVVRGGKYAFKAKGIKSYLLNGDERVHSLADRYDDGQYLLKIVDGVPGDTISITPEQNIVNGSPVGKGGLLLFGTLMRDVNDFVKSYVLEESQYFFAGRTNRSFDSRYWGPVEASQIIGRAYAIF